MRWAPWLLLGSACVRIDVAAILPITSDDQDAGALDAKPNGFCDSSGPVLLVGDSSDVCGGSVAERVFRFAVCSCEDFVSSNALTTDSFDSRIGPYLAGGRGGSVGINRHLNAGGPLSIGGSLWVSDPGGLQAGAAGTIDVAGELRSDGPLLSETRVSVGHDAWIGGRVRARDLEIDGTLHYPPNEPLEVSGTQQVGAIDRAEFNIPPPCDCDPSAVIDVPGYISRHATVNDNASIDLDPAALGNLSGPTRLELPCGRFYVDRISGPGALTISVQGRAALFVDGDLSLENTLIIEVGAAGELDLFVAGAIVSGERLMLGSPDRPARVRTYFGTSGTLQLSGGALLAGNLYAPKAELTASAPIEAFGSLFVRRINSSADLTVHYDTAVLNAADDCPEPAPTTCASCKDCRNNACHADGCGSCTDSSECCAPLSCIDGTCLPEL